MDIANFNSGKNIKQLEYSSFSPERINHSWIISSPEVNKLLAEANRLIGELNAFSQIIPDVDFFISMHILKEATTSSRIEGTKTNMEEALIRKEDINPGKRDDWAEVQNYIDAINYSIKELEKLPISNRLIKNTHKVLLSGVRGKHKISGEFRISQNWIGATLKDAIFVPPHHFEIGLHSLNVSDGRFYFCDLVLHGSRFCLRVCYFVLEQITIKATDRDNDGCQYGHEGLKLVKRGFVGLCHFGNPFDS